MEKYLDVELSFMNITKQASYNKNDAQVTAREYLFRGFVQVEKISLRHRLFESDTYTPVLQRELIKRPEAAGVLIYDDQQQKVALIEQYRVGALDDTDSPWQLEIIAGVLDGNESPETCIRREALEESGCTIHELQHLFTFYPSAGACSELFHLYAAEAVLPTEGGIFGMPDEGENIQLHLINYAEISTLLVNGRLKNAPVIMALQWLQMRQHTAGHV
jgi:ADP-ribose pyrophosphatase